MQREEKKQVIANHQKHETDTGSFAVQIAIFTKRIFRLTEHLKANPKDKHSKQGLYKLVGQRRKLLNAVKQKSVEMYKSLIEKLGIRG